MKPDIIPAFPEPRLASMPQLSKKPRLGFTTSNQAWNLGFNVCNSTAAMGLQFACSKTVSDPVESPNNATIGPENGKSIPNVPPDPAFCGTYRDGTGAGSIFYNICMKFPNFPSQKWNHCVRGKLMNRYVRNGNPLDLTWYLFVNHPVDFVTCPVN
jgi:hypothetical protein